MVLTDKQSTAPSATGTADTVAPRSFGDVVKAYVALTKPRIIELLLITTLPVMFLAARGLPPLWIAVSTLVFGTLSAGSANALNCYIDRDIDAAMRRTRRRPLARDQVPPANALIFGVVLGVLSTLGLGLTVNWLAAGLSLAANLFYVLVYSMILKRRTSQNVVWGGLAGCMPVLIGWAGITGSLDWAPLVLFGVVFFWTPPHTWTLAMRYKEDYAAAKVPMLPVVATERRVVLESIAYTWATVACSLLLWPIAGTTLLYPAVAVVLGAACLWEVYRLLGRVNAGKTGVDLRPMRFFHWSNAYLALLFLAVAVDSMLV
ncbi:heme o synthase [Streptosporangium roseum]|uniref:Protoheme IX farnesyltransferase n=1 Tax=Streptosporangium roseum (strain ATCC 12428 / DSM 43021 / JCM 3005 / KCTC 9067 / NCIMB 10171 / NRRL 2505 / NI 9100) TaxID=479432 RepID=D2AV95_STRRD|nr:heme o synthase [Streptosporangium roseum]ACZ88746.1 protoheme IX farnesyltransferase [Streptosporangium roseum DSM 43021]